MKLMLALAVLARSRLSVTLTSPTTVPVLVPNLNAKANRVDLRFRQADRELELLRHSTLATASNVPASEPDRPQAGFRCSW